MAIQKYELGDHATLKELSQAMSNGLAPLVEVQSMDGIYTVRLHDGESNTQLSNDQGRTLTFHGTGKIRELLGSIGLTHGVLTWRDQCGDEMIGIEGQAQSQEELLANGTRISFR
ncbi:MULTISPECIES: DUF6482 family protein [Gammaproteobacteria]|uniref:Uncharacterized protein n=1 Tax=Vreelandella halophila TaxID=86177 RepID=A0A9X4YH13_9GAMM|nr:MULTISPECIES: DUF6482 family protein [Gammaproteobacteria]KAA8985388.1 hypothetical protein F3089_01570 [Halospina sp. K52047b]MYL27875.1 hypothetical protein [Halomonas utahensis]MYL75001.1 hypothetical protein [Halomonas sp. 22501_18_FS]